MGLRARFIFTGQCVSVCVCVCVCTNEDEEFRDRKEGLRVEVVVHVLIKIHKLHFGTIVPEGTQIDTQTRTNNMDRDTDKNTEHRGEHRWEHRWEHSKVFVHGSS